jgi:glutathione S-transferase
MIQETPFELSGAPGSPYTRKMLAVLRYRRLPYRLYFRGREPGGYPVPKPPLLPTFYLRDDTGAVQAVTDSTPLIRRFDAAIPDRPVRPADPAVAFLDSLIEDYADEWLTKCMFHYRWAHAADAAFAGRLLPSWGPAPLDEDTLRQSAAFFSERQISRLAYVGSNPTTAPVIEDSYVRLVAAMEAHLSTSPFMLGRAPGAGDFGLFGQLTQLAGVDPTPTDIARQGGHRVMGWVGMVEDLSGLEPGPFIDAGDVSPTLKALLAEMGRVYAPLLIANARALQAGQTMVETEIDGRAWTQNAFPYQAKCLGWLREEYAALPADGRRKVDAALADTGWSPLFAGL